MRAFTITEPGGEVPKQRQFEENDVIAANAPYSLIMRKTETFRQVGICYMLCRCHENASETYLLLHWSLLA